MRQRVIPESYIDGVTIIGDGSIGNPMRVAGGLPVTTGFVIDSLGVSCPIKRAFVDSPASLLGANPLIAAVAGQRIRVLEWQEQDVSLINFGFYFLSNATKITAELQRQGTFSYRWMTYTDQGHFQTAIGESLQANYTVAGVIFGINLLYIETASP